MSDRKMPYYHTSNIAMYHYHNKVRRNEVRWKMCDSKRNAHVLRWQPGLHDPEPNPKKCQLCEIENKCCCDGVDLLRYGCQCGGK